MWLFTANSRRACAFYTELHETLGSRPEFDTTNVASSYTSSSISADIEIVGSRHTTCNDTERVYDKAAIESDTEQDLPIPPRKKMKGETTKTKGFSKQDIIILLQTMEERKAEEEKENFAFLKQMQTEKMSLLKDLVETVQDMAHKH